MFTKAKVMLATTAVACFIFIGTAEKQKPQWKGTIEKENGIKVIKNPKEPLYGEITFNLEEDLSIGNEEDENYMFYRGVGIEVDSKGNIYVMRKRSGSSDYKGILFDLVNQEGYYLYKVKIPNYSLKIENGYIYSGKYDKKTGYNVIKRYKIKN